MSLDIQGDTTASALSHIGMQEIYSSGAKYRCDLCSREFDRKDTLLRHKQVHSKSRQMKQRRKACIPCSKGKIRCSNERPSCSSCTRRKVTCVYDNQNEGSQDILAASHRWQDMDDSRNQVIEVGPPLDASAQGLLSPASARRGDLSTSSQTKFARIPASSDQAEDESVDTFAVQDIFATFGCEESAFNTNLDWIFDPNGNYFSLSPLDELQLLQQTEPIFPQQSHMVEVPPVGMDAIREPCNDKRRTAHHWAHGDLPSPEPRDIPSPEDPWPIDIHAGPTPRLVLPFLGDAANRQGALHFSTRPISSEEWLALKRCVQLPSEKSFSLGIDVDAFPNKETLDYCIDLYFAHVHQMFPIIHRPTFKPGDSVVVTLAMISLGACFTHFKSAHPFSNAMSELNRRLLLFMAEQNRRFVRTEPYLTAQLLQNLQGFCSGDERLFELSESCRSSLVIHAKCMGLFRDVQSQSRQIDGLEDSWHEWIRQERLRRLGWAVYEYDTCCAYLHNGRPHLNIGDAELTLPCSMEHWDAPSAYAWSALHPWTDAISTTQRLKPTIKILLEDSDSATDMITNERHRLIIILTLSRLLWSLKELRSSPMAFLLRDRLDSSGQRVVKVLERFIQDPILLSRTDTRKQVARAIHARHLIHMSYLYSAGDFMNLYFPFLHSVLLHRNADAPSCTSRLFRWAREDSSRVRAIACHCAQILALTRQFPENLTLEPFHVFYAGVILMVMSRLLPAIQDGQTQSPGLRIDHLSAPDDPASRELADWILIGGEKVLSVHGVPTLQCRTGWGQILDETVELLKLMRVWGIAEKLVNVVLKIRHESLDVNWHA